MLLGCCREFIVRELDVGELLFPNDLFDVAEVAEEVVDLGEREIVLVAERYDAGGRWRSGHPIGLLQLLGIVPVGVGMHRRACGNLYRAFC